MMDWFIDHVLGWAIGLIILALVLLMGLVGAYALTHHAPPSLFCANGTEVHASPATEIIGKTPVDGVRYTCS